jgi:hypothetical protein
MIEAIKMGRGNTGKYTLLTQQVEEIN